MSQKSALWKQKMELSRVNDYKKKWKHLYQINTLEDNSWHDNPKNVIIIPWILLFSEGLSAVCLKHFQVFPFCIQVVLELCLPLFLFGLVLISSLLHSVWNSKYYYPLHNFISSSASVFNSLWLHLINRECLTLLFVVMSNVPSSLHFLSSNSKRCKVETHYHCYSPSHISFLCSYDEIC